MTLLVSLPYLCIHAIVLLSYFFSATYAIGGNETDRLALLEFKAEVALDPIGVMNSWNNNIHFCQWYGVTCGRRHQRVTMLDLHSLQLVGSLSPQIGNLSFLRVLDLKNNSFSHNIPPEIGRLRRLQTLYLYNNSFGGGIPSNMSGCSNLIQFSVVNNLLIGEIPIELGSLMKLQFISVSKNSLTGTIPTSLGNLSSLQTLSAAVTNLDGRIPDALGQLKNLTFLGLSVNNLSGTVPTSIFNLSSITLLDIGYNQLQGNLPSNLATDLPNLNDLAVAYNQFTGPIPISLFNASNLEFLQLQENKLMGKVSSLEKLNRLQLLLISTNSLGSGGGDDLSFLCSLTNATSLRILGIENNNFGGVLPECIGNFSTQLEEFLLHNNQISGSIPTGIENLVSLTNFQVYNNRVSGIIPPNIGKLQNLVILILDENKFSGYIPLSLGNLTKLSRLHLAGNNLQGIIPSSLRNCQNLQLFDVSRNNLSGDIPPEVIGLSSISLYLGLSQNHFTGTLPMEVGNLKDLGVLDVSSNMLSGEIPSNLGSCIMLEFLYMQGNFFQGPIPPSLYTLRGLQVLNLSHNNFSGEIPEFLASFVYLLDLNLSYNDFEGMVPTEGVFKNTSVISLMGNNKLCGGIPEFQLPTCHFKKPKKRRLTLGLKLVIAIVSGLLGVALVLSFLFLYWFRKKWKEPTSSNPENSLLKVSYQSLLKATDGFSSANLIGVGSFGSVYKGILDENGMIIAVKVLNLLHRGASKSFMAECEAVKNIRHRNLVKVVTACSSIDYHGNDFKALIFEFMVNGSLENWLHPRVEINEEDRAPRNLNLLQRLNIAIDVACALEYLHHHCETQIVHCDLKPSNILLDDEMTGRVGDFGLAKFLSEGSHNITTNQSSSVGVRGTIGYAPPEYGMGSEVSTYGDVYSYGILLLEMFTRKRPTDDMFKEGLNLHNFVKAALPERAAKVADPILLGEREEGETSTNTTVNLNRVRDGRIPECLVSIFEIGITCSAELPRERLNISDVVTALCSIRDKLLGTRLHRVRSIICTPESAGTKD